MPENQGTRLPPVLLAGTDSILQNFDDFVNSGWMDNLEGCGWAACNNGFSGAY